MLMHLHVKNFALIEEADLEFGAGLNILTGETGAGKSILIDAVNVALGGKAGPSMIRQGADYAYVELVFQLTDEERIARLKELEVDTEDGTLILSRRILKNRSIFRINDETVTAARVRRITGLLIDIHGQHEHQSLMYKHKHLEILDAYAGDEVHKAKGRLRAAYDGYVVLVKKLGEFSMEEEARLREVDFLKYEIHEIEAAALKEGEEEELELTYKKISNSRQIMESMGSVCDLLSADGARGAAVSVSKAYQAILNVMRYDDSVKEIVSQIRDLESILSDVNHDVSLYMDSLSFDGETYRETEERLNLVRNLKAKYGKDYRAVMESLDKRKARLAELENYEENREATKKACHRAKKQVLSICGELSELRKAAAGPLVAAISKSLNELNFLQVSFDMKFEQAGQFGPDGYDDAEFVISTNPGQPMAPMKDVASGGELSRIMLAVKTVLADTDRIPSLIFDEIDTGISGRTAACVSDKLSVIAKSHQVLCITHLPQIASHADQHFMISKAVSGGKTCTTIQLLDEEGQVAELARMLGGVQITDAVLQNARELKALAIA